MDALARYRPLLDDWSAFVDAAQAPLPLCGWTNTLRIVPARLQDWMASEGSVTTPLAGLPGAFRVRDPQGLPARTAYLAGLFHLQEAVSMWPAALLGVQPGHRVLDLCAAPGGKSAQLAVALGGRGTVVANDLSRGRLSVIQTQAKRLGLFNLSLTQHDARTFPLGAGGFDRVLADVPCSCEGTSRKHPPVLRRDNTAQRAYLTAMQRRILERAYACCKPGGRIVYATCTYAPEENEAVVDAVLRAHPDTLRCVPVAVEGFRTTPGILAWDGQRFQDDLRHAHRFWPHHNDTGGFFIAVLEKGDRGETPAPASPPSFAEADPAWADLLTRYYGIPATFLEAFHPVPWNDKYAGLVAADHVPPPAPTPLQVGGALLKLKTRYPKLTTQAAQTLAPLATRNVVDLRWEECAPFLDRAELPLDAPRLKACRARAYVLVRQAGVGLGLALLTQNDASGTLSSLFPKAWGGIALTS